MIRRPALKRRRGATLLEMAISITVMGILLALVVPSFARVREQNMVDSASQYLRSIWCAERVYWLEHRTFTDSMMDLKDLGLIDSKLMGTAGGFNYEITDADATTFTIKAMRTGNAVWGGTLQITHDGDVTGFVDNGGAIVLTPSDF